MAAQVPGSVPLHRLYNPNTGDHFYTTSDSERDSAASNSGYQIEADIGFVYDPPVDGSRRDREVDSPRPFDAVIRACIEETFRQARVPPFPGGPINVGKTLAP